MGKKKKHKSKHNKIAENTSTVSTNDFLKSHYTETDKIMLYVLIGFFLFGIGISFFYDTWKLALIAGGVSLGMYLSVYFLVRGSFLSRAVVSLVLWNFGAQFIAQMHGMYEMHFFFFIACTILLLYKDWKVIIPITLYTVAHHIFLYIFNYTGDIENSYRDFFVDVDYLSLSTFIIHLGIAAIHAILCGLGAYKLHLNTIEQVKNSNQLAIEIEKHKSQEKQIKLNINLAEAISEGNLDVHLENKTKDSMTEALLKMRESLFVAKEKENTERYVIEGVSNIESILRAHNDNLKILSDKVVSQVVNYINAAQGALFLVENKRNEESYMTLTGAYAYDRSKFLDKKIQKGEGLAGECWIEGKIKDLSNLPNDYVQIRSALGKTNPQNIYIVPLEYNENILGVFEIASFDPLSDLQKQFIDKVAESIAGSVSSVKVNEQTTKLLQESQDLTEQMRAQEEELRQNQEEMMATQEETNRQMSELKQKHDAAITEIEALKKSK